MGATSFEMKSSAMSLREAYTNEVEQARAEYGNDSYNGTISTTRGIVDKTSEFRRSLLTINEFVSKTINEADKWGNCFGICIREPKLNTNKVKTKVEKVVSKGAKKWITKHVVYARMDNYVGEKLTQGDAIKLAQEHTEKTKERTRVEIVKVLEKGNCTIANITYKASTNETEGQYYIYGIAAE